ncbi:CubicO group peptidase, beta-lactamase class C family [Jatrophihabitans endophyticus]|uniref:CubicO group peptidase, beta-lactamase class C family n=1 Tax=Jatrophihabitans endophyticus TaxID=1206085 RepID=A0A1M5LV26_9ACTN|nr:serine hydrolase domain-containing protein [Jatrophihabitans endophyticus]SHG68982.1 CubicO group peptidase, beta-lactamase class C family [Jatrophihabitans endophyticus]
MSSIRDGRTDLASALGDVTRDFAGVVSVSRGNVVEFEAAFGPAERTHGVANRVETQFGIASGTKGFTAVAVAGLVGAGVLALDTTARSLLGRDLPLVHPEVTVAQLLAHTSGVGDYLHPDATGPAADPDDYVLPVPPHALADTEGYVAALAGRAQQFRPGARFAYSDSGYVLLALLAERAAATPFPALVGTHVFAPAEMWSSAFLRSDRLPARAAVGYVGDGRSNVLHLPVRGCGDGGAYSTAGDLRRFWTSLFAERILPRHRVAELVRPRHREPGTGRRYGRGFWLPATGPAVVLEGCDAGVSFRSVHDPTSGLTHTVLSNTTRGAWPVTRRLDDLLR